MNTFLEVFIILLVCVGLIVAYCLIDNIQQIKEDIKNDKI